MSNTSENQPNTASTSIGTVKLDAHPNPQTPSAPIPIPGTQYCCAQCTKVYVGKRFHCYSFDCCSSKCLNEKIKPFREAEARKEEEARARRTRGGDHVDYGGGDCH